MEQTDPEPAGEGIGRFVAVETGGSNGGLVRFGMADPFRQVLSFPMLRRRRPSSNRNAFRTVARVEQTRAPGAAGLL